MIIQIAREVCFRNKILKWRGYIDLLSDPLVLFEDSGIPPKLSATPRTVFLFHRMPTQSKPRLAVFQLDIIRWRRRRRATMGLIWCFGANPEGINKDSVSVQLQQRTTHGTQDRNTTHRSFLFSRNRCREFFRAMGISVSNTQLISTVFVTCIKIKTSCSAENYQMHWLG